MVRTILCRRQDYTRLAPGGQRFLVKAGGGSDQPDASRQLIVVVQHFDEELKRLVPTK